jgi:hypothetical protein
LQKKLYFKTLLINFTNGREAGASNTIRVLENTMNRMEEISEFPTIDENSKNVKLKHDDITFDHGLFLITILT